MSGQGRYISALNNTQKNWDLHVKILRLWKKKYGAIDMLLMDEKRKKIEGKIANHLGNDFKDLLREGCTYSLQCLNIGLNQQKDGRASDHEYVANFVKETQVKELGELGIPRYGFDFKTVADINDPQRNHAYLIDFIGALIKVDAIEEKNTKRIIFYLQDKEKAKIKVTLFGDDDVERILQLKERIKKGIAVVMILWGAQINLFNGTLSLQPYWSATQVITDDNIPEIMLFKEESLEWNEETKKSVASNVSNYTTSSYSDKFLDVSQIKQIEYLNYEPKVGMYVIRATIESLEPVGNHSWFYQTCSQHICGLTQETDPETHKDGWKCGKCNAFVTNIIPRFRIKLLVADCTGSCYFTIFRNLVEKTIKVSCATLMNRYEKTDLKVIPPEFNIFKGKTYLFKVEVKQWNVEKRNSAYTVAEMTDKGDIMTQFDDLLAKLQTTEQEESSVKPCQQDLAACELESCSENGSNSTPSQKRGRDEPDIVDVDKCAEHEGSTTKPPKPYVKVKVEKGA